MPQRQISLTVALLAAVLVSAPNAAIELPVIDVREHVFANGFRMIMVPRAAGGMVHARMYFGEGSVLDPPGLSGLAHMFEHLVYEGTARLGTLNWAEEKKIFDQLWKIEEQIEHERNRLALTQPHKNAWQMAGQDPPETAPVITPDAALAELEKKREELLAARAGFNRPLDVNNSAYFWGDSISFAGTGTDATQYIYFLPGQHLEALFWIEADKFKPVIRNFDQARDTVQEQVLRWGIDPEADFGRRLNEVYFASPFGRDSGGGYELEQASPLDARRFAEQYLVPGNAHLVLVGEFDPAAAIKLGERYFAPIPKGNPPPRVRVMQPAPVGEKRLRVEGPGRPRVELRLQLPPGNSAETAAIDLLVELLDGPDGRLAQAFAAGTDLVSVRAARRTARNWGYLSIVAFPRNNDAAAAVESGVVRVLDSLMEAPVPAADLDGARQRAEMKFLRMLADGDALSAELGNTETISTWRDVVSVPERWKAQTPSSLLSVAKSLFGRSNRTVGIYVNGRRSS